LHGEQHAHLVAGGSPRRKGGAGRADNCNVGSRTPTLCCLHERISRRLGEDDGFTIIEVLVSAVIVAMIAVGTFTAFDSATATSGRNKARSIAAGLARSDQERVRAKTPLQLANLADTSETATPTVNGRRFTVVSSAVWTTDPASTTSCAGLGKEAGYMRITSTVSWTGGGPASPVTLDSLKALPSGGYKNTRGSIAVNIANRGGTGVAGVPVTITGPRTYNVTTNANGCVLVGLVPLGDYTVTYNKAGYVEDTLPNPQAVSQAVTVSGEQTASTSFNYDQAGSFAVAFKTRVPPSTTDTNANGDGFTLGQTGLGFPNRKSFGLLAAPAATAATGANNAAVALASAQKVLYPFTTAYTAWAGACAEGEPTQYGQAANGTGIVTANGAVTGVTVRVPTMGIKIVSSTGTAVTTTYVIKPVVTGCTNRVPLTGTKTSTSSATQNNALPYGDYTVCAQDSTAASARRVVQTIQNRSINGTTPTSPASNTLKLPATASTAIPPCT
jgi:prepilin-type N-terminal cleavage/methylation domain-containing protein